MLHIVDRLAMMEIDLPTGPITHEELMWLRKQRRDEARCEWAWRILKRVGLALASIFGAAYAAWEFVGKHLKVIP